MAKPQTPLSDQLRMMAEELEARADELERARVIAAMPIPQDIIDESQIKLPEFALPVCPDCGSTDGALLESADPVNVWSCEACGAEWSDEDESASDEDEEESQGR